jgi:hypothetical protein
MIQHDRGGVVLMHDVKKITAEIIAGIFDDLEASNCAKLAAGQTPIIPVTLHYFLKRGKESRAIPPEIAARVDAYKQNLPARCAKRAPTIPLASPSVVTPAPKPAVPPSASSNMPSSGAVIPVTPPSR